MKCKNKNCEKKIPKNLEKFGGINGCCSFHCSNELNIKHLPRIQNRANNIALFQLRNLG